MRVISFIESFYSVYLPLNPSFPGKDLPVGEHWHSLTNCTTLRFLKQGNIVFGCNIFTYLQFEIRHVMRCSQNITPLSSILVYCILRMRKHCFILRGLFHDIATLKIVLIHRSSCFAFVIEKVLHILRLVWLTWSTDVDLAMSDFT